MADASVEPTPIPGADQFDPIPYQIWGALGTGSSSPYTGGGSSFFPSGDPTVQIFSSGMSGQGPRTVMGADGVLRVIPNTTLPGVGGGYLGADAFDPVFFAGSPPYDPALNYGYDVSGLFQPSQSPDYMFGTGSTGNSFSGVTGGGSFGNSGTVTDNPFYDPFSSVTGGGSFGNFGPITDNPFYDPFSSVTGGGSSGSPGYFTDNPFLNYDPFAGVSGGGSSGSYYDPFSGPYQYPTPLDPTGFTDSLTNYSPPPDYLFGIGSPADSYSNVAGSPGSPQDYPGPVDTSGGISPFGGGLSLLGGGQNQGGGGQTNTPVDPYASNIVGYDPSGQPIYGSQALGPNVSVSPYGAGYLATGPAGTFYSGGPLYSTVVGGGLTGVGMNTVPSYGQSGLFGTAGGGVYSTPYLHGGFDPSGSSSPGPMNSLAAGHLMPESTRQPDDLLKHGGIYDALSPDVATPPAFNPATSALAGYFGPTHTGPRRQKAK